MQSSFVYHCYGGKVGWGGGGYQRSLCKLYSMFAEFRIARKLMHWIVFLPYFQIEQKDPKEWVCAHLEGYSTKAFSFSLLICTRQLKDEFHLGAK